MIRKLFGCALRGVDATEVEVEVNEGAGEPQVVVVGLPDAAVRESRDRVVTALSNSGFRRPKGRLTINLAPADLRKEGPGFDLAMALGMVAIEEKLEQDALDGVTVMGELALDGKVRPVKGVLAMALCARAAGRETLLVPAEQAAQASVVQGLKVIGVENLAQAFEHVRGKKVLEAEPCRAREFYEGAMSYPFCFSEVKGQEHVKRALEVAAAGHHNVLMIGSPGTGKSMLAKRMPSIMPGMSEEEAIETTKIHGVAGLLQEEDFVSARPFRSPHHTVSDVGLLGGGSFPGPGEVSLAHHGVLFLDEFPEFRRNTLEVLRQPLEDGKVTISRASGSLTFPASFLMVAAMNPCPCGYHGDPKRACRCSPNMIAKYRQRISGPLLDRIDLHVEVPLVEWKSLQEAKDSEPSAEVRKRVMDAREVQRERFQQERATGVGGFCNSEMSPSQVKRYAELDAEGKGYLERAMEDLNFSARAHDRILKVARTLADLSGSDKVGGEHVLEAIQYRSLDREGA